MFSLETGRALEAAARTNLSSLVTSAATEVEGNVATTRSRFERFAAEVERHARSQSDRRSLADLLDDELANFPDLRSSLSSLEASAGERFVASSFGLPEGDEDDRRLCGSGESIPHIDLQAHIDVGGDRRLLLAGRVSLSALLARESPIEKGRRSETGTTLIADRDSGTLIQFAPCAEELALSGTLARFLTTREDGDRTPPVSQSGDSSAVDFIKTDGVIASSVHLNDPAWTIARVVSADTILAPIWPLQVRLLTFVLLVGAAAILAFRLASRRFFRSLEELQEAVERMGRGDFDFWLPPPGKDEAGWLSFALGRMAERITQMVRGAEKRGSLAVVGEIAAHVAHEIRTPLSSIKMTLQRLQRGTEGGTVSEADRPKIDACLREIDRLEKTVLSVLDLGGDRQFSPRPCSLHALIADTVDLLEGVMDEADISVSLDFRAESDRVRVDPGRVKGVFLNLVINALDANPTGGKIAIRTQLFLDDGGRQMLGAAVSDTGPGVPEHLRTRIFDPFFTTKEDGGGMGLSSALKTIQDHGGDLFLSEPPNGEFGACFVVVLPLLVDPSKDRGDERRDPGLQVVRHPDARGSAGSVLGQPPQWASSPPRYTRKADDRREGRGNVRKPTNDPADKGDQ